MLDLVGLSWLLGIKVWESRLARGHILLQSLLDIVARQAEIDHVLQSLWIYYYLTISIVLSGLVGSAGQVSIAVEVRVAAQGWLCWGGCLACRDASLLFGCSLIGCVCMVSDLGNVVYYVDIVVDRLAILWRGRSGVVAASGVATASGSSGVVCVSSVATVAAPWIWTVERIRRSLSVSRAGSLSIVAASSS